MGSLFLAFTFFSWLIITILGGIYDAQGTSTSVMNQIVTFQIFREQEASLGGLLSFTFPVPNLTWFKAVGDAVVAVQAVPLYSSVLVKAQPTGGFLPDIAKAEV